MVKIEFKPDGKALASVLKHYQLWDGYETSFKIACPFHEENVPSLMVDLEDGSFFCFGCQVAGDAFNFVRLANNKLNDLEACKKYFKILKNNSVETLKISPNGHKKRGHGRGQALIEAKDYYFNLSPTNWIKDDSYEKHYLKARGLLPSTLNKCQAKLNCNSYYPIIFPLFDNNCFKGYMCRTTNKEVEEKRKYLYNKGFTRRDTLIGDYKNLKTMILVEGYIDRLKLIQFGVDNVVAILGWKATLQQVGKLHEQGVENVLSMLDNDERGKEGTRYLKKFFNVKKVDYPGKDPGDLTRKQFKQIKEELKWQN